MPSIYYWSLAASLAPLETRERARPMRNALGAAVFLAALTPLASAQGADCTRRPTSADLSDPAFAACAQPSVYALNNSPPVAEPWTANAAARGAPLAGVPMREPTLGFTQIGASEADGVVGPGGFAVVPLGPLTVPRGGSIEFSYTLVNWTSSPATGDLFFRAIRNGVTLAQGEIINNGTLPAGQTVTGTFIQNVPQNAPVGEYLYFVNIGRFPNYISDSEIFPVTVTSGSDLAASPLADWADADGAPWASSASAEAAVVASPNPFAGETTLRFTLETAADVRLAVYDLLGREVALLADGAVEAGPHSATFDASALPSGVYVYRLAVGDEVQIGRLTLAR